jgi:hypothetical protein
VEPARHAVAQETPEGMVPLLGEMSEQAASLATNSSPDG